MEVQMQEDHDHQMNMVIKRRRTKRPRPSSPLSLTIATSSCSTVEGTHGHELDGHVANSSSSPSNSGIDILVRNTEEEDMANCLILLAQGRNNQKSSPSHSPLDVYQCKTCTRCFPSFQALGGHRASHKKPKLPTTSPEEKNLKSIEHVENCSKLNEDRVTTLSLQIPSGNSNSNSNSNNNNNNNVKNKNRVHECSICGAEFTSGQALGGHMRRHRPLPNSIAIASSSHELESSHETKNTRNFLSLDLNLPAPEDDHRPETKFSFASKEQVIVFSASPLVDCHY